MLRPVSLLPALAAALAVGLGLPVAAPAAGAGSAAAAAAPAADTAPLSITIDSLTPAALPKSGPVRISGSITNTDDTTWSAINLYPFVSDAPMTTEAEIAEAAESDPTAFVGERILDPAPYETIASLAPGDSVSYSFAVPRREIAASEPGVYWFGVHALGQGDGTRDEIADGRARTFLPLLPASQRAVDTALVVPIRHGVRRDAEGRIANPTQWTRTLSTGGHLRGLTDFGVAAGDRPITWLVDPAVVDAAGQLAAGNPARSIDATLTPDGDGSDESPAASPTADPSASPDQPDDAASTDAAADGEGDAETDAQEQAVSAAEDAGTSWLQRLHTGLAGNEILSLPYGDVDADAAAHRARSAYTSARERSGSRLAPWGLPTSPAIASPSGLLSLGALRLAEDDTRVLLSDSGIDGSAPGVAQVAGHTAVVTSSAAVEGGPGPNNRRSATAMRQRILSEAAVRAIAPGNEPLVVVLPSSWKPSSTVGFFEGLDLPWIHLTTVGAISQRSGREIEPSRIDYPERLRSAELQSTDFGAAAALTNAGGTLQRLLTLNDRIAGVVADEAYSNVGYAARRIPASTRASSIRSRGWIEQRLRDVEVEAPRAVILASGSGRFSATITNTLDQPVTVRLDALTESLLQVSVPEDPIEVAADSRTSVLLNAASDAVGVRNATILLTDAEGTPLGSADTLPIRSNRVSNVIWLIVGTGIGLLFATIIVRLVRRVRRARASS